MNVKYAEEVLIGYMGKRDLYLLGIDSRTDRSS
jgi:hypothetical protein